MNEKKTSLAQVFLACFFGFLIGWVVGQKIAPYGQPYWWAAWIASMVSGGLLAYIFCDPAGFVQAISRAATLAWRKMNENDRRLCKILFVVPVFIILAVLWSAFTYCALQLINGGAGAVISSKLFPISLVVLCYGCVGFAICIAHIDAYRKKELTDNEVMFGVVVFNPLAGYLFWPSILVIFGAYFVAVRFWEIIKVVVVGCRFIVRTVWYLYQIVHTEARLICLLDAVTFAGAWYFTDNLVWAVTGAALCGVWGVVNYKLLAPRLILAPARAQG